MVVGADDQLEVDGLERECKSERIDGGADVLSVIVVNAGKNMRRTRDRVYAVPKPYRRHSQRIIDGSCSIVYGRQKMRMQINHTPNARTDPSCKVSPRSSVSTLLRGKRRGVAATVAARCDLSRRGGKGRRIAAPKTTIPGWRAFFVVAFDGGRP